MKTEMIKIAKRFLPLRVQEIIKPYFRTILPNMPYIVFIPTYQCNYRCSYCTVTKSNYARLYPKTVEREWNEWVNAFSKFPPSVINISGGEPFLYDDLIKLMENIQKKHVINSMFSNFSLISDEKIGEMDRLQRTLNIVASFHPPMSKKEVFAKKILKLNEMGFNVRVNYVTFPEDLSEQDVAYKSYFENNIGVIFTIGICIDPLRDISEEGIKNINKYADSNYKELQSYGYDREDYQKKVCKAGSSYCVVTPNGDVYTCMAGFYYSTSPVYERFVSGINTKQFYLGNLFDECSFKPLSERMICSLPCSEACDLEAASVERLEAIMK